MHLGIPVHVRTMRCHLRQGGPRPQRAIYPTIYSAPSFSALRLGRHVHGLTFSLLESTPPLSRRYVPAFHDISHVSIRLREGPLFLGPR